MDRVVEEGSASVFNQPLAIADAASRILTSPK
jgi:hypothetical protein